VELSKNPNLSVLSRSEWTKLIREYEILKQDTSSAYSKFGNISGANALIIMHKEKVKKKEYVVCKLVDTNHGVVLDALVFPKNVLSEENDIFGGVARFFTKKLLKLVNANDLKTVSLKTIAAETASPEALKIERHFNTILSFRLKKNPDILLTERNNMPEVLFEKYLNRGVESSFLTGSAIVDGSFKVDKNEIKTVLRIKMPDGKTKTFEISENKGNLAKLAEKTAEIIIHSIGAVSNKHTTQWNMKKEADEYFQEAKWAYKCGLYTTAAKAAESAWALGLRDNKLINLRIISYARKAYTVPVNRGVPYAKDLPDVTKKDENVNAAVIAMDLISRYYIDPKLKSKKYGTIYRNHQYNIMADTIHSVSNVLWAYYVYHALNKDTAKRTYIRKLIIKSVDFILNHNIRPSSYLMLSFAYIPVWYQTPDEMEDAYKKVIHSALRCAGTGFCSSSFAFFSDRMHCNIPYILDWNTKTDNYRSAKLSRDFLQHLVESDNPQFKLLGLSAQYDHSDLFLNLNKKLVLKELRVLRIHHRDMFYQGKLWFGSRYGLVNSSYDLLLGYPDYLMTHPDVKLGPSLYLMIWPNGGVDVSPYSKKQLKALYDKITEWEKNAPNNQKTQKKYYRRMDNFKRLKKAIISIMPEVTDQVDHNTLVLSKFWTPYTNSKRDDYYSFFINKSDLQIENNSAFILLNKLVNNRKNEYFIYAFDKELKIKKRIKLPAFPMEERNDYDGIESFDITSKYTVLTLTSRMIIYNRKEDNWSKIDFKDEYLGTFALTEENIYIAFFRDNELGILRFNYDGNNRTVIASSRRKFSQNPIDKALMGNLHDLIIARDLVLFPLDKEGVLIRVGEKLFLMRDGKTYDISKKQPTDFSSLVVKIYKTKSSDTPYLVVLRGKEGKLINLHFKKIDILSASVVKNNPPQEISVKNIYSYHQTSDGKISLLDTSKGLMLFNTKYPNGIIVPLSTVKVRSKVYEIMKEIRIGYVLSSPNCSVRLKGIVDDALIFGSKQPALFILRIDEVEEMANKIAKKRDKK